MRCLHPVTTRRGLLFPCGKCPACLNQDKEELAERIFFESRVSPCSYFLTLTYNEENLPFDPVSGLHCFDKEGVEAYIRRVRDFLRPRGISLRIFLSCEYGDISQRPHYHAIAYLSSFLSLQQAWTMFNDLWRKGIVYLSSVGAGCCRYVAKYCLKDDEGSTEYLPKGDPRKPFRSFPRRPGVGATDECVQYWYEVFGLRKRFFQWDSIEYSGNGEKFLPKIPRVVRSKFDEYTQRQCTAVGWSRFYSLQEDLGKALQDSNLNVCVDPAENRFEARYDKDLEIMQKTRKLRKLKKNCL